MKKKNQEKFCCCLFAPWMSP